MRGRRGLKFVALFGLFLIAIMGLGMLRYHSARLAYYLESLNNSIQRYTAEETLLKQELSALVAPIRIYSYCKEQLGMMKALKAEVLPIQSAGPRNTYRAENKQEGKGWRLSWLLGE